MIVINRAACSPAFASALDTLEEGADVRRTSWPAGQVLRKRGAQIVVIREGSAITPPWIGPSSTETNATDWVRV